MGRNEEATLLLKIKTAGEEALSKITITLGDIIGIAKSLGQALIKPVQMFKEQEEATNALTQAMINNGIYSQELKKDYLDQASALQKLSTFGDEQIIAAQAAVQQQIGQQRVTKELTLAILDFAAAQKMDLASAAEVVGKSIGTSTNALGRYGIEVSKNAGQTEKMAEVVQGLSQKFGGQAEAAADGLGSLKQLENALSDIGEELGGRLAPVISLVARSFTTMAQDATNSTSAISIIVGSLQFLTTIATSVIFAFNSLGTTIGGVLGTLAESMSQLIDGEFSRAKQSLVDGFTEIGKERERIQKEYDAKIISLNESFAQTQEQNQQKELENLSKSYENKAKVSAEFAAQEQIADLQKLSETQALKNELIAADREASLALLEQDTLARETLLNAAEQKRIESQIAFFQKQADNETNKIKKLEGLRKVADLKEELDEKKKTEFQLQQDKLREQNRAATLNTIATLQSSNNSHLVLIGKAAALAQIAIDTPVAIGRALAAAPPPFNFGLAAAVGAAMAAQAAQISGIQLAEGGIVMPRPGGVQATIGEAGQAEAVIPLDRAGEFGLGGGGSKNITIVVNGGMLGDEANLDNLFGLFGASC
ncbi:MAG: hypothetical protein AABY64_00355 [Bdellovibrionota bacterium]